MTELEPNKKWTDFLGVWPPERVRKMTIEEYTNTNRSDAFIYWLEKRLEELGSIWGGSAFKFGIYCRDKTEVKESSGGRIWGEKYAWLVKFGKNEQEAFATIRGRLVEVLEAVQAGNIARIEEIELSHVLKWKVAFLYQNRSKPLILPIYKREMLLLNYQKIDPRARFDTPYYVMYETLLERHREVGDILKIAEILVKNYKEEQERTTRAWAIPLALAIQDLNALEAFCNKIKVEPEDIDSYLDNLLSSAQMSEGDEIALLVEGDVRALGKLENVEPGQFEWNQTPVNFPSGLLVNPTSEIKELDAAERAEIWGNLAEAEVVEDEAAQYWKLSAEEDGRLWPSWRDEGYISIGWKKLGDLKNIDKKEFEKKRDKLAAQDPKGHSVHKLNQVWRFRNIGLGARIVANQGTTRVFGFGTVTGEYYYVAGDDYPHRLPVRWDDVNERRVNRPSWLKTLIPISNKEDFNSLLASPLAAEVKPKIDETVLPSCEPQNIILHGPPGTGKTYSTRRRALELVLGAEAVRDLRDEKLKALYDEKMREGQIEFVTFHQAYGYEEFIEGIRPVLDQVSDAQVRYEIHDGVFKRIALRAAADGLCVEKGQLGFDELWDILVRDLSKEELRTVKSQKGKTYQISLSEQGNIVSQACEVDEEGNVSPVEGKIQRASKENSRLYWENRSELGPEPEKLTYDKTTQLFAKEKGGGGGNHYTALWIVYNQLWSLNRALGIRKSEMIDRIARVQQALDKPGPTTTFSFSAKTPQYVLIIDEINRGNMSKILGELITLLEPDKRLTKPNELKLPLSYTPQHRFAVPPNLHVLGTMNTADRSIALMDVALRRRFTFEELMPDAEVIRNSLRERVANKAFVELVVDLFTVLNHRIRFLYDRDHQLGHSYFMNLADVDSLRQLFVDRIVPMLQEYFYGAWDKICMVLGSPYDESGKPKRRDEHLIDAEKKGYAHPIVTAQAFQEKVALGFDHDDYEDRVDFSVRGKFKEGSLSHEDLYRTFLGVLAPDRESFEKRLSELIASEEKVEKR